MPSFYLMPNGKVAAVALDGGRKSLVTRTKFEECCCPDPCGNGEELPGSCPCESWLPTGWPCNGMVEEMLVSNIFWEMRTGYTNTGCLGDPVAVFQGRAKGNVTITATTALGSGRCVWWKDAVELEQRSSLFGSDDWTDWEDITPQQVVLGLGPDYWSLGVGSFVERSGRKNCGSIPLGLYEGATCISGFTGSSSSSFSATVS